MVLVRMPGPRRIRYAEGRIVATRCRLPRPRVAADEPHSLARRFRLFTEQRVLWELIQHRRSLGVPLHLLNEK